MNFANNPSWLNGLIFALAAAGVWAAGTKLSEFADVIAVRTGLGRAFIGLLLLAGATSLPELATTVTAAAIGNVELLGSNLLGGVAMQTAIVAALDLLLVRRAPLTYFSPDPKLLIDGVMLVGLLGIVVLALSFGAPMAFWGMSPWSPVIFAFFMLILWVTHSESTQPQWQALNPPPVGGTEQDDDERRRLDGESVQVEEASRHRDASNARLYASFAAGSLVILVAGYVVTLTGEAIATRTGLGNTFAGAILVAVATSLPEVSTTSKAIRLGAYSMALANIFGSNAFDLSLFFVGDVVYRQGPIFESTAPSALFLTGLGIIMTCAYLWGMLERRDKTVLGMGIASAIVLIVYVGGMVLLHTVMAGGN